MKNLFQASRVLLLDMASTLLFLGVYVATGNLFLAVGLGMALGLGQIAWHLFHREPVEALQWLSVVIILASGTATFFTNDPLFVMLKPSVIYVVVGVVMLKRGWMSLTSLASSSRASTSVSAGMKSMSAMSGTRSRVRTSSAAGLVK